MTTEQDMENRVEKVLEDSYKRKRIRAYATAALTGVIQRYGYNEPFTVAEIAFNIAEAMEKQEHVRNR